MAKEIIKIAVGATVAIALGAVYGMAQPSQSTAFASIMLSPNIADSGDSIKGGFSPDAPSPIHILKGILESHACLAKVEKATKRSESALRTLIQLKPINKELRLEMSIRTTDPKEGVTILNKQIEYLGLETGQLSYMLGTQQAELLKKLIDERQAELDIAQDKLKVFQETFSSALEPEVARARVLSLTGALELAKGKYQSALSIARQSAKIADSFDSSDSVLNGKRRAYLEALSSLRETEISMAPTAARVQFLKEKVKLTRLSLDESIATYKNAIESQLEPSIAKANYELLVVSMELDQAKLLAKNSASESQQMTVLRREVDSLGAVLKGLRTDYEKARTAAINRAINYAVLDAPYVKEQQGLSERLIKYAGLFMGLYVTVFMVIKALKFLVGSKQ